MSPRRVPRPPGAVLLLIAFVIVVGYVGAKWMEPWLTREVGVRAGTPVPPPRFQIAPVALDRGRQACLTPVSLEAGAATAVVTVQAGAATRLRVTAELPGTAYRGSGEAAVPAAGGTVVVAFDPPDESGVGRVCLRNVGKATLTLVGNAEPGTTGNVTNRVAGKPVPPIALELGLAGTSTRLDRASTILGRASDFSLGFLGTAGGWILVLLAGLLVPLGTVGAVVWAMRLDRRAPGPDEPPAA